jgi:hypothetical protein
MSRAKLELCFTPALTFYPLPRERKWQLAGFGCADERPANPVARIFMETANDSPSPWGEGRVEGGREPFEVHNPCSMKVERKSPSQIGLPKAHFPISFPSDFVL